MSQVTPERFVQWAEEQVRKYPTIGSGDAARPNTVEYELACLLSRNEYESLLSQNPTELRTEILDYLMDGVEKPWSKMTREELLKEIQDSIIPEPEDDEPDQPWEEFVWNRPSLFEQDDPEDRRPPLD